MKKQRDDIQTELADTADNMAHAEADLRKARQAEPEARGAAAEAQSARDRLAEHDQRVRGQIDAALAEDPAGEIPVDLAGEFALIADRPGGPGDAETVPGPRWHALEQIERRAQARHRRAMGQIEEAEKKLERAQHRHRWAKLKAAACELPELSRESITWTRTADGMQALDGQVQLYTHAIGGNGVTHHACTVELCGRPWTDGRAQNDLADQPAYPGTQAAQSAVVGYLQQLARKESWPVRLPPDAQSETVLRRHREKGQPSPFVREVTDPDAKSPTSDLTAPRRPV